jgi:hydrogenase nickel incorporation protein HypA/HybF
MHEMAITQSIVDAVRDRIPDRQVVEVRIEIGRLCGVVADSVQFCFELVTEGTNLAGATLSIEAPDGQDLRIKSVRVAAAAEVS